MKKLLFPILFILMSCSASVKTNDPLIISDLDTDFPVTDTISFSFKQSFEILSEIFDCKTKDSILYVIENGTENCGHCYNINNGEQISTIVTRGKANNEMLNVVKLLVVGDSVQLRDAHGSSGTSIGKPIKMYAHKDILTKPMGERDFSTLFLPDSLSGTFSCIKTSEGEVFGTIPMSRNLDKKNCYFAYGDNGVIYFGDLLEELVELKVELNENNMRRFKSIFARMHFSYCDGRIAAANSQGILLEVLNTEQKKVERGKYYNKYILEEGGFGAISDYRVSSVGSTKENIFCHVKTSGKDSGENVDKSFILVFDWELNPVKKFYVANNLDGDLFWFSNDCKSICRMNVNTEKQELFEGKIVL